MSASCRARTVFGVYDGGTYGALERVTDHLPVPPAHEPRQRLWHIVAKRAVLAAGAIERPHRVRRQRPAGRDAGRRGAHLPQPLRRGARDGAPWSSPTTTRPPRPSPTSPRPASRSSAVVDARPDVPGARRATRRRRAGAVLVPGGRVVEAKGGAERADVADPRRRRAATACRLRPRRGLRRLEADDPPHHPSRRQAGLERAARGARARHAAAGHGGRRRRGGTLRPRRVPRRRRAAGADGRRGLGLHAGSRSRRPRPTTRAPGSRRSGTSRTRGKAFVDLQNDVTAADMALAAREGFRIVEHLKRYTTLGMATDQGKTANAAGMAVLAEATGRTDRRGRHDDVPPALHAGRDRRLRRPPPRQGFPADPADAVASPGPRSAARSSSRPASGCAPSGSPSRARATGSRR